jgi:5-methylcytosine-specific restriction endonuclease McrA
VKGHERRGIPQSDAVKDVIREKALSRSEQIAEDNRRRVWTEESRRKASEAKRRKLPAHHFKPGDLNPQYKHGREYERPSSSILLRRRAEIIESRGFRCESCGDVPEESTLLHMHHIDDNPFNNTSDNLKLLCVRCHNRITHPI